LGLIAVTGATKALAYQLGPVPAALLGMVTRIGGGVVRDALVSEVPAVFRKDIYVVAALIGASVVVIGSLSGLPPAPVAAVGASCASPFACWRFAGAGTSRLRSCLINPMTSKGCNSFSATRAGLT
jgi:uncharacterized membrane protein YeiH